MNALVINENINVFIQKTQAHFTQLKQFVRKEFFHRIQALEEEVRLTDEYMDELINIKSCLLEVQQRFFEMRSVHKDNFLTELESMILMLVHRVMNLELQVKNFWEEKFRKRMLESNEKISQPIFESLYNAKKFHLKKLIRKVENQGPESLVLTFNEAKLYELQLQ